MTKIKRQTVPDDKNQSKNGDTVLRSYHIRQLRCAGSRMVWSAYSFLLNGVPLGWIVQVRVLNVTLQNGVSSDWAAVGSPLTWFLKLGLEMIGGLGVPS